MFYEYKENPCSQNQYNCPMVISYPENIRNNLEDVFAGNVRYIHPFLTFKREEALVKRLTVLESCLARHARRLGCEGCDAAPEDAPCHGQCTDKSEPADTAQ